MASLRKRGRVWYFSFIRPRRTQAPNARDALTSESPKNWPAPPESEAAKIKAGLVDTRELARIVHSGHPLDDHFTEYRASLIAKGATEKHVDLGLLPSPPCGVPWPGSTDCPI